MLMNQRREGDRVAMQIRPSKKALMWLVSLAMILLLSGGAIYHNRAKKLNEISAQIELKEKELNSSERIARRLNAVETRYLDAQATLGALEQGVSSKTYVPTLLRQVEELAKKSNLKVVGVRPKPVELKAAARPASEESKDKNAEPKNKREPYDRLDLDLEVTGKYWDMVRFIEQITCFPKIVTVNDVQMAPDGSPPDTGSPDLKAKLSTTAFILRDEPASKNDSRQVSAGKEVVTAGGGEI